MVWLASAAAAEADGFRPCRRCRPQAAPGTPAWLGSSATISRALRLISEGALDNSDVEALAGRLGIGSRQLRRLFVQHLGASPLKIAITRRVHFAQNLLEETDLPITGIATSAGFTTVRQFNHSFRKAAGKSPTEIRRLRGEMEPRQNGLVVRLPYRPPFCWPEILGFLKANSIPGVEAVDDKCYRRTIEIDRASGTIAVWHEPAAHQLAIQIDLRRYDCLLEIVERVRRIFDLGADPVQIANHLELDPQLRPLLAQSPGLRVPGVWHGFELAVAAILGQRLSSEGPKRQISMRAFIKTFGAPVKTSLSGLTHLFPSPGDLVDADLSTVGVPPKRARTIRDLAQAVFKKKLSFHASKSLDETIARLVAVPGISEDTAQYIAMRAFAEPDAFPAGALESKLASGGRNNSNSAAEIERAAEKWRPWRAYAAVYLCTAKTGVLQDKTPRAPEL